MMNNKRRVIFLAASLAIVTILITVFLTSIVMNLVENNKFVKKRLEASFTIECENMDDLIIKDGKLYDQTKSSFVTFTKNNEKVVINEENKIISLLIKEKYSVLVFSKTQEMLLNDLFLYEGEYNQNGQIYIVSNETKNCNKIDFPFLSDLYYFDLKSLVMINEKIILLNVLDINSYDIRNVLMINFTDSLIGLLNTFSIFSPNIYQNLIIDKYVIDNKYGIIKYKIQEREILGVFHYTVTKDTYSLGYYLNKYDNQEFLFSGYFGTYQGKCVYLDNNLNVKQVESENIIETLKTKEEFRKYQ